MSKDLTPRKYQILLAEDDEVSQEIVRALLGDEADMELTIVGDGKLALEAALQKRFDLLIFDQNLPFITGDRVVRHLRAGNSHNAQTPILRFSAHIDAAGTRQSNGFVEAVLPKPLRSDIFVTTVKAMLDGK